MITSSSDLNCSLAVFICLVSSDIWTLLTMWPGTGDLLGAGFDFYTARLVGGLSELISFLIGLTLLKWRCLFRGSLVSFLGSFSGVVISIELGSMLPIEARSS